VTTVCVSSPNVQSRRCRICGSVKPLSEFYVQSCSDRPGGIRADTRCKDCVREINRKHYCCKYKDDPEFRQREVERCIARRPDWLTHLVGVDGHDWKRRYHTDEEYRRSVIDRVVAWQHAHPAKRRAYGAKRRARKIKAWGEFSGEQFKALCSKYKDTCLACGSSDKPITADHIIPLARGGSNDISNIQPLCMSCNSSKGTKIIDYRPDAYWADWT